MRTPRRDTRAAHFHPRRRVPSWLVSTVMTERVELDEVDNYQRRRASDRARERATRAAYLGDRAGLLIATGAVVWLMRQRIETNRGPVRPD